jgi:hypothetical protein
MSPNLVGRNGSNHIFDLDRQRLERVAAEASLSLWKHLIVCDSLK